MSAALVVFVIAHKYNYCAQWAREQNLHLALEASPAPPISRLSAG